ncbi:hypothetical protein LTR99_008940 [Exophiala xenobiotica]|nr:hypothetical protein LTR96_011726 [Exophiala xenobiotica]KAK5296573.1 hypothetical protein LTR99_008940 [Exophiala xenobiotica]
MDGVKTSKEAPPAEIRTIFDGWDPLIHRLLEKVSTCRQWKTSELEEIPRWISESGKIVLVGDSAHAMLPFLAQGAAMAIEDSVVLVECLSSCKTVEDAPDRLRLYETTRRERVRIIKSGARQNATVWHCADGPFQEARDAIIRYGKDLPTDGTLSHEEAVAANRWNNPAFQEWLFGFDAVLNAKEIILKREL